MKAVFSGPAFARVAAMTDILLAHYNWLKALHVIAIICWMAGLLYLPRLFVYHAEAKAEAGEIFKIMERRLLKIIMNPAMIAAFLFGTLMLAANPALMSEPWMHAKLGLVFLMAGLHGFFAGCVRKFANGRNVRSAKFYRIINEVPAVLMVIIVLLAVAKPF